MGEGNGTPLQYSCLEKPMDGGAWWAAVHGVAGGRTRLSDFTFTFHFHALDKEMATHSSILAWRIPGTGEPGGLPSMGWHRVGHDWSNLAAAAAALVTLICLVALSEVPPFLNSRILSFTYLFIAQTSWRSNTLSMLRAAIITYISWYLWIWVVDIKSSILASSEVNGTSTCL